LWGLCPDSVRFRDFSPQRDGGQCGNCARCHRRPFSARFHHQLEWDAPHHYVREQPTVDGDNHDCRPCPAGDSASHRHQPSAISAGQLRIWRNVLGPIYFSSNGLRRRDFKRGLLRHQSLTLQKKRLNGHSLGPVRLSTLIFKTPPGELIRAINNFHFQISR
jgi:hypothetical protein